LNVLSITILFMKYNSNQKLCLKCAEVAIKYWKGWPPLETINWNSQERKKSILPDIPKLDDGTCNRCQSQDHVFVYDLVFINIHGSYSTGLPDYFRLAIDEINMNKRFLHERFGIPYLDNFPGLISIDKLIEKEYK
jgi:hypothetical protein